MTRADHVAALGGGVVGDLAGFCAATYQRGVPIVHVPTTSWPRSTPPTAARPASICPQAKNYVGAYHQPAGVLVDPDLLATLPAAELTAGWVEVLKTALISGGELWERVSVGEQELDERMIVACARTKLAVVAEDERDAGRRQVLNLGHTVGHAIETATGYARYRHGEAVGLGLLAALRLSGLEDLRAAGARAAARARPAGGGEGRFRRRDPRRRPLTTRSAWDRACRSCSLEAPGVVRTGCEVPTDELRAAVEELMP